MKRQSKLINNSKEIEYFVNLTEDDITTSFIMKNFAEFNGKSKYRPYDLITIPPNSYHNNKNSFTTTVGIWVFNKYFIENDLFHIFKYLNQTVNKKLFGKINKQLSYALIEDDITLEQFKKYLMKTQKFMPYVSVLSPGYSLKMLTCTKEINKKKKELLNKHKEELDKGNEIVAEQIEKELLDFAKEYLKDDPSLDSYDSGARGSFNNNFKNMFVMKGAIRDAETGKYNIATSSYMSGVVKDEYYMFANSLAEGPYKRAVKTAVGGYWEKQFVSAFQHVVLDKKDSDCGTKRHLNITLTDQNIDDCMYNYIIEGNHLVELNSKNRDKYLNKTVKMRFSSLCESKTGICNKCAGNLYYRLDIKNVGLSASILASTLKNLSMKSFHSSVVTTIEMDPMKAFGVR